MHRYNCASSLCNKTFVYDAMLLLAGLFLYVSANDYVLFLKFGSYLFVNFGSFWRGCWRYHWIGQMVELLVRYMFLNMIALF